MRPVRVTDWPQRSITLPALRFKASCAKYFRGEYRFTLISTTCSLTKAMARLLLFNKPFQVLCQFSPEDDKATLADYLVAPGFYPAGRLDHDSEGLLLLTDDGQLQARIANPRWKQPKTYWVQVEGSITPDALALLCTGVTLNDGPTLPAPARLLDPPPTLWERTPPVRYRASIPTSWIELVLCEGRNRQVRRMTAAVGFPTLRLVRVAVGDWSIDGLAPGQSREINVPDPVPRSSARPPADRSTWPQPNAPRRRPTPASRTGRGSSGSPSGTRPPRKPRGDGPS